MIDYSKFYTGFWHQGSCGNFILYLMSCHTGFYSYAHKVYHTNDQDNTLKDSHLEMLLPSWKHYSITHKRTKSLSFDYYWLKHKLSSHNKKVAFKQLPHDFDTKRILTEDHKKINFFILESGNDSRWLVDRTAKLKGSYQYLDEDVFRFPKLKKYLKKHNYTNVLFLDITKILKCNNDEYTKLCNWIQEEPLLDWKDIIQDYKKLANIELD